MTAPMLGAVGDDPTLPFQKRLVQPGIKAAITAMIPKGVIFEEVFAEVLHALHKNPQIAECTIASVIRAIGLAAKTGLIIGETVHLVPFEVSVNKGTRQQANWVTELRLEKINDYKGDIELVTRSGAARTVRAFCVYAEELAQNRFEYVEGTKVEIIHNRILMKAARGPIVGAYAIAEIALGIQPIVVWMDLEELDEIRAKSQMWNPKKKEIIPAWWAKKTPIKQVAKFLSKNSRVAAAAGLAELVDGDEPIALNPGEEVRYLGTGATTRIPDDEDAQTERAMAVLNDNSGELVFAGEKAPPPRSHRA